MLRQTSPNPGVLTYLDRRHRVCTRVGFGFRVESASATGRTVPRSFRVLLHTPNASLERHLNATSTNRYSRNRPRTSWKKKKAERTNVRRNQAQATFTSLPHRLEKQHNEPTRWWTRELVEWDSDRRKELPNPTHRDDCKIADAVSPVPRPWGAAA